MNKGSACNAGDARDSGAQPLGREDPLEKEMATHSSIFLENPIEEPGRLQSIGS